MAELLKGAPVAKAITAQLTQQVEALKEKGVVPTLSIVRVGERPDDISYEKGAMKRCDMCGIAVKNHILPADATEEELLAVIEGINQDPSIHGVLLFRPLPKHINENRVCAALAPEKDMDGITDGSMAGIFSGSGTGYPPCTAQACIEILDHYGIEITGKKATVLGRSNVIGKPVAMLLLQRNATVTVCHTRTKDLPGTCAAAEILIAAAGKAGVVSAQHVSEGQIVLDVGINVTEEGNLVGDVDFAAVEPVVSAITPVPAGVGSVTTAVLAKHVVTAAEKTL
ncbi:MAG: bifunctional 5,10-methylene-tetrahydrofolate dehydrogenase/5,10-methylene-tetrahydrofolate cyclohydrolase [Clostridia bacterium]|nr:bifunctional 5,10-methylene-tetrahydrofolate dehydrogenase/5,10-methylene-tetrahydrofolate cyclohydrolase [Clostridia bacterium]MBQ5760923.1 bifunctional 5,10-methylene-tetrahydrofolate dehydrogenase/5,10-methylene-tetrahydrofolate cyclohydrolase [Clostridia bacterium]